MKKLVNSMKCLMVVVTLMFISTGCHNDVKDNPYAGYSKTGMKFKNIVVSTFTVSPKGVAEDDPRNVREHMLSAQTGCASELMSSNLFDNVSFNSSSDSSDSTLIVKGELTELRIVGGAARAWLGAMAGKSVMAFDVKLIDSKSGKLVAEREIKDDVGNMYVDSQLPRIVGQFIAEFVINSSKI
jgi:Domain of unknown function (DUF4410)